MDNLDSIRRDLLAEARALRGEIRPLPGHPDFNARHFTVDHYKGKTWLTVWYQYPLADGCPDSTGMYRKEIMVAS